MPSESCLLTVTVEVCKQLWRHVLGLVWVMVFNTTFYNTSVISLRSVLLVKESGLPQCRKPDLSQVTDKLNSITLCCNEYTLPWTGFELTTSVVIGTDCMGSYKSNYHAIMTMTTVSISTLFCLLMLITVKPVLGDHSKEHWNIIILDRWSLYTD